MRRGIRIGRLRVYASKIARGSNGSDPPWRGYCWGSDFPRIQVSRQASCLCIDLSWLCYFASLYWSERTRDKTAETHKDGRDKTQKVHKDASEVSP